MTNEAGGHPVIPMLGDEHRQMKDRRSRPTRFISRYTMKGRRKKARRREEANNYYVDRFEPRYLVMIGLIMIFCVVDFCLSIKIFDRGGSELNVFMANLMSSARVLMLFVKLGLTSICLLIILAHKNFKVFGLIRVHVLIYYIFSVYLVLVLYESYSLILIKKIESFP